MSNTKVVIYHHDDLDGRVSAYLAAMNYSIACGMYHNTEIKCIECNYDNKLDFDVTNSIVWIVDYSFTDSTIYKLFDIADGVYGEPIRVIWVDHHASSENISKVNKEKVVNHDKIYTNIDTKYCGAMGVWNFIKNNYPNQYVFISSRVCTWHNLDGMPIPLFLAIVDDHDCWKHKISGTKDFVTGSMTINTHPLNDTTSNILYSDRLNQFFDSCMKTENAIGDIIRRGALINDYLHVVNNRNLLGNAFIVKINKKDVICMNNCEGNSDIFGDTYNQYSAVLKFDFDGVFFYYTLYCNNKRGSLNCAKIAEKFGGGGHHGAAGFKSTKSPTELFTYVGKYSELKDIDKNYLPG